MEAGIQPRFTESIFVVNSDTVPASLVEYAESLGKRVLPLQSPEDYNSACVEFYKEYLG